MLVCWCLQTMLIINGEHNLHNDWGIKTNKVPMTKEMGCMYVYVS